MRKYYKYSKKQFEYEMRNLLIKYKMGFFSEITDEYIKEGNSTWERIYKITTKNPSVDILLFSSIDIRTDKVRDHAQDAVRLVLRWKTKNGYVYKRIAKHLRIGTLFDNIHKSIKKAQEQVFNLNYREFSKDKNV